MKTNEKIAAISLRKKGFSYKEIAEALKIAKATLSCWLRDVELSQEQIRRLKEKCRYQSIECGKKVSAAWDERRIKVFEEYNPPLTDPDFMLGLGLFWRGDKGRRQFESECWLVLCRCRCMQEIHAMANKVFRTR